MDFLRPALMYVILIAAFYGGVLAMKALSRVQVPSGYTDVENLEEYTSYRTDQTVAFSAWKPGDALCWRLGPEAEQAVNFGWVAGLPGDRVQVREGHLEVNGQRSSRGKQIMLPDCGPIRVPAQHLFVINDNHYGDSIAVGPLPSSALRGRLGSLP
jgi:Signal peptidase, peptidase S26